MHFEVDLRPGALTSETYLQSIKRKRTKVTNLNEMAHDYEKGCSQQGSTRGLLLARSMLGKLVGSLESSPKSIWPMRIVSRNIRALEVMNPIWSRFKFRDFWRLQLVWRVVPTT